MRRARASTPVVLGALVLAASCGGAREPPPSAPAPSAERPPLAAPPSASADPAGASSASSTATAVPVPSAPPSSSSSSSSAPFPPAKFDPPVARTARAGDGVWSADARARLPKDGAPAVYSTVVHPHPIKPFVEVAVVALDLERVALRLVAGTDEPESKQVARDRRTGLVAPDDLARLVAVWNGGFKARHGNFGMRVGPDRYVPPRDEACVVLLAEDGGVRMGSWSALRGDERNAFAFRQTPPCLVEAGSLHPDLDSEAGAKKWGAAEGGARDIRRSAVGLDAAGRTLFYAMGEWTTAKDLAVAVRTAGAAVAAELDINWSFTFFVFFGDAAGKPEARGTLMPKTKAPSRGFVDKPVHRDFFYVAWRR